MKKELIEPKAIVNEFVEAIRAKDIGWISNLLDPNGVFDIELPDQDTLEVNREEFMNWLAEPLNRTEITSVEYDQCLFCKIGNPVVLFNKGKFPRKAKVGERPKAGMMLNVNENGLIDLIQFCFTFLHRDNVHKPSAKAENFIEAIKNGLSPEEAHERIKKRIADFDSDCEFPF